MALYPVQPKTISIAGRSSRDLDVEVGGVTETEGGCEYHRLGSASHLGHKILPAQHVSPCFLRSQEALHFLEGQHSCLLIGTGE